MATVHRAKPLGAEKKEIYIDYNPSMELRANFQKNTNTVTMLTAPSMSVTLSVYGINNITDTSGTSLGNLTTSNPIDVSDYKYFRLLCPKGTNGRCTFKICN